MMRTKISLILLLTSLLVACTGGGETTPIATESGTERVTQVPTPTATPLANFRYLFFPAQDGEMLAAAFYPPQNEPAPGLLLLHAEGGSKEDWALFVRRAWEAGYAPMALDLPGHGESAGEVDWELMPEDVLQAWNALLAQQEVNPASGIIIGAGAGADLALAVAATEPAVPAVVLVSPLLEWLGTDVNATMTAYGDRPLLVAAANDDTQAAESAQALVEASQGVPVLALYPGEGVGVDLLADQPDLINLILGWLRTARE